MGQKVEMVRTPLTKQQLITAIISAWRSLFGTEPAKEQVSLIMAHNAFETGHTKSMWNYNIGNITLGSNSDHDYYEAIDKYTTGPMAGKNFKYRAYSSAEEGVKDYLEFLSKSSRYGQAWQHILNPDPASYSRALKEANYYTADESQYTRNLVSLFDKFNKSKDYEEAKKAADTASTTAPGQLGTGSGATPSGAPSGNIPLSDLDKLQQELSKMSHSNSAVTNLNEFVNIYLKKVSQANKKYYKKYLPNNLINIKIKSDNLVDKIEFANILCLALDEELLSDSFVHTDGKNVDIECNISGQESTCFEAVAQVTQAVADNFKIATKKIGSVRIDASIILNKKSSYPPIDLKVAELNHRKFLFKFA